MFFKESEWGPDPAKVTDRLKALMENIRGKVGVPIAIHCSYASSGHASNSYHYRGMAADFHCGAEASVEQQLDAILAQPEAKGIGFYPNWKPRPGWHVDVRENGRVFWIGTGGEAYVYFHDEAQFRAAVLGKSEAIMPMSKRLETPAPHRGITGPHAPDFGRIYDGLIALEGDYGDVPGDSGGETYKGCSRNKHPEEPMWARIDATKAQFGTDPKVLNPILAADNMLQDMMQDFYREQFWTPLRCAEVGHALAAELMDFGVNAGPQTAVMALQRVLNMLNTGSRGEALWDELPISGNFREKTMEAMFSRMDCEL